MPKAKMQKKTKSIVRNTTHPGREDPPKLLGVEWEELLGELSERMPPHRILTFLELTALIAPFCETHLNQEYLDRCGEMALELCIDENSPVDRGKIEGWACGIVYAVGWVNFLTAASNEPHVRAEEIAGGFGVSIATMHKRFAELRQGFGLIVFDPEWSLPSTLKNNPLAWVMEMPNGLMVDARCMPREFQERAFKAGLIPFVPNKSMEDLET